MRSLLLLFIIKTRVFYVCWVLITLNFCIFSKRVLWVLFNVCGWRLNLQICATFCKIHTQNLRTIPPPTFLLLINLFNLSFQNLCNFLTQISYSKLFYYSYSKFMQTSHSKYVNLFPSKYIYICVCFQVEGNELSSQFSLS